MVEAGRVEAGMLEDPHDGVLLVLDRLGWVEAAGVILPNSHLQQAA